MSACGCSDEKDKPDKPSSTQRVYGRGMLDGLRMAGVEDPETVMNEARLQRAEEGLTGLARKVLECVPLEVPWSVEQIQSDLRRNGHHLDHRMVLGALTGLYEKGLVKEPQPRHFIRVQARKTLTLATDKGEPVATKQTPPAAAPAAPPAPTPEAPAPFAFAKPPLKRGALPPSIDPLKVDVLGELASLAERVRNMSNELVLIAIGIENTAIAAQEQLQAAAKEGELLRQFQSFIKSIKGE